MCFMYRSIVKKMISLTCAVVIAAPISVSAALPVDDHDNLTKDVDVIAANEVINSTNGHNVGTNNGSISEVSEKSTVATNNKDVSTNNGTIEKNAAGGDVFINKEEIISNAGKVDRNYADVTNDGGTVGINYAGGNVTNNSGTVEANLHNSDGSAGTVTGKSASKEMFEIAIEDSDNGDEWDDMKITGPAGSCHFEQLPDWKVWVWDGGYIDVSARDRGKIITKLGSSDHPERISKRGKGVWRIQGLKDTITINDIVIEDDPHPSPEPEDDDDDDKEIKPAAVNPDTVEGFMAINGQPVYGLAMGKTKQGPAAQAVFNADRTAGWQEAFSFNMAINGKVDDTVKNGVLTIIVPAEYRKGGRTFAVMALDKNGGTRTYADTDMNPATVTAAVNFEGYAFSLIYRD